MLKSRQEVVTLTEEIPESVQRVAEIEVWKEKFPSGAENALRARPKDEGVPEGRADQAPKVGGVEHIRASRRPTGLD